MQMGLALAAVLVLLLLVPLAVVAWFAWFAVDEVVEHEREVTARRSGAHPT